jgi:pimeloyl-ACP methyl ester carboxylesterase
MPQTQANGVTLHYEDHGNPSDPAMLLIMGFGAQLTLRRWSPRASASSATTIAMSG